MEGTGPPVEVQVKLMLVPSITDAKLLLAVVLVFTATKYR